MSVWARLDLAGTAARSLPACTRSRGEQDALLRGADPRRPVRTSETRHGWDTSSRPPTATKLGR
jgi:hypothetical protein